MVPSPSHAAAPQEAHTDVKFVEGCSGEGYWFTWDAVVYPDHTAVPEWGDPSGPIPAAWSPSSPITDPDLGPEYLEENRYGFILLAADRETILFQAFYDVQLDLRRFVLDVTLDCSTIPYRVVEMPNAAMAAPDRDLAPIGLALLALGVIIGAWQEASRRVRTGA